MKRTIHPVGQGAYYSEQFDDGFTTVYDCGTFTSQGNEYINHQIEQLKHIDLLFISHFHEDHINGIIKMMNCGISINKVIIPFTPWAEKLFYIGQLNKTSTNFQVAHFIISPEDFIRDSYEYLETQIVSVTEEDNERQFAGNSIPNGSIINKSDNTWIYIPFIIKNKSLKNDANDFYNSLVTEYPKFQDDTYQIKNEDIEILREKYIQMFSKRRLNETSMIVLSTPSQPNSFIYITNSYCIRLCRCSICNLESHQAACLYMGDLPLRDFTMNELTPILDLVLKYSPGLIQIPHHGSETAFNKDFWEYVSNKLGDVVCFASHGYMYKHPHEPLLEFLEDCNITVVQVTFCKNSVFKTRIIANTKI